MIVLGIGGSTHDFGACVVVDGKVSFAVEEERLSRIKHHSLERLRVPRMRLRSVDYCLREIGATLDDVDLVVANDLVYRGALRGLPAVVPVNHHLSHAALVSYTSPRAVQAILVVDGFGSMRDGHAETVSYFVTGDDRVPRPVHRETNRVRRRSADRPFSWKNFDFVEHSLGELYSFVTESIGFGLHDAGKTMGLAPYGSERLVADMRRITGSDPAGRVRFDAAARGELAELIAVELAGEQGWKPRADVARGMQAVLEEALLRRVHDLHRRTGRDALAVGGGVFLNSVANRRIREEGPFRDFYVHGATGDSGTAIGAALYAYHRHTGELPCGEEPVYLGRSYPRAEILAALRVSAAVAWTEGGDVCARAAAVLADGGIVGWFQGRSEFGPRALGNRSILADPGRPGMKDRINSVVKHREGFRPFAPAILGARQAEVLDTAAPSGFMCVNGTVRESARRDFAAATHIDGSARYQTVTERTNPRFHELISRFEALTGVPGLLNTSFNDNEPIVETPGEAIECFLGSDIDCLVVEDFFVTRR
ncbi:carbamoyltransferase C-terminal domain-containing protein [Nocardia sp. BMG51109]|uniref:carbamoyltransferase family protein n=1 Tax=Nocardia sp. BMG51109 TaxID=1056816 RepID=UPI00046517DB|nr:carbamoyltransferase C-terminal domain-containing protein [Nocardia sp. BMG51109]